MKQKTKSSNKHDYRNSENSGNKVIYALMFLSFLLVSAMLLSSIERFYSGYHNADLGQNIRWLNEYLDMSLVDLGSDFKERSGTELYIIGMESMKEMFLFAILYSFIMGLMLCWLILVAFSLKRK